MAPSTPLAANLRGALWITLAAFLFAIMMSLAKLLGERLHIVQIGFVRAFFGLLLVSPMMLREGLGLWRTRRLPLHIARAVLGATAMIASFYAVTHMALADATAISFTRALFMVLLAAVILGEAVGPRRWAATLLGFLGVVIMARPAGGVIELAALVALFGALCGATVSILIKQLSATEKPATILAYLGLVSTLYTGIPAALVWQWPTRLELGLLIALASIGSLAQLCLIRGFRIGEASALAPFDYCRLPFAAALGYVVFAELPGAQSWAGALIIVMSTLYIARREAAAGRGG